MITDKDINSYYKMINKDEITIRHLHDILRFLKQRDGKDIKSESTQEIWEIYCDMYKHMDITGKMYHIAEVKLREMADEVGRKLYYKGFMREHISDREEYNLYKMSREYGYIVDTEEGIERWNKAVKLYERYQEVTGREIFIKRKVSIDKFKVPIIVRDEQEGYLLGDVLRSVKQLYEFKVKMYTGGNYTSVSKWEKGKNIWLELVDKDRLEYGIYMGIIRG